MSDNPQSLSQRQVGEWVFKSTKQYANPFVDVKQDVTFSGPDGKTVVVPSFYDGDGLWRVRFNPDKPGSWHYRSVSNPEDPDLTAEGSFQVTPSNTRGFLKATPGKAWGFHYESGEPAFLFGDTVYNLFAMQYCGGNVSSFLERRANQGFNLLRIRVPVSPFHPPRGYSDWQTRRTNPWGGSETSPRFDQFNLDYFKTVDEVVQQVEDLGMGIEMIMEGWGFEFPFNSRQIFLPEWEELWMRYLIARYDAYNCLYFWTPLNEYEYYPNGDWHHKPVSDRWALRISRWIKSVGQHGHIIAMHNGPRMPAFAQRFHADPGAVDAIMFQEWGTRDREKGWLAAGIENQIKQSFENWWGSFVFAEYGYERNPDFDLNLPGHEFCDAEHTRRGAWRGAFCAAGVIHGFENSWGPWLLLEEDQPGMVYLLHMKNFFLHTVPFDRLTPRTDLIQHLETEEGYQPLVMASEALDTIVVYYPAGGQADLRLPENRKYRASWYDPRTGTTDEKDQELISGEASITAPQGADEQGHPFDYVLVLKQA